MTYATLTPKDDESLHWRQPAALRYVFVLAAGDREFARLEMTGWSSSATAETATGRWALEHRGFWSPEVVVRAEGRDIATLHIRNAWLQNRADLCTPDGQRVATWHMESFVRGLVQWTDAAGAPLITFRGGTDEGGAASWRRTGLDRPRSIEAFTAVTHVRLTPTTRRIPPYADCC